ncbi:MAG: restriction endonuclease subunit S [Anaeroglobus sp.]|nr:restriction endonuclease subunit S [Anaeroglobus sp.]
MEEKKLVPKLRFPGFTEPWEQRKLGDVIASLYNGQTPSRFDKANWEGDIPWLTSGELNRGVVNHSIEKITPQGRDDANLKIVPKGTVVIAITGLEAAGTRGNCAKLGFDTTLNQSCMAIYPKSEFLDPDFLFQWYIAVGEEYGIKYTQGTKQQSYNAELIKILPISVPRVTEQRKITRILDSFDDIITLHQRKLEHLKLKKKSLLQKLFPKEGEVYPELRFPGFTNPWEQRKLGETATVEMNKRIFKEQTSSEGEVPFYKIGTFGGVADSYISRDLYEEYKKKYPYPNSGDILISASGSIGRTVVYNGEEAYFQDSNIVWLNHEGRINNSFLLQFYNVVKWSGLEGSTIKRLYNKNILETPILLPKLEEQQLIGGFLKLMDDNITLHQRKLEHLQLLKKALLQQLFV